MRKCGIAPHRLLTVAVTCDHPCCRNPTQAQTDGFVAWLKKSNFQELSVRLGVTMLRSHAISPSCCGAQCAVMDWRQHHLCTLTCATVRVQQSLPLSLSCDGFTMALS